MRLNGQRREPIAHFLAYWSAQASSYRKVGNTRLRDEKLTESYLASVAMPELVPVTVILEALRHETGITRSVVFMNKLKGT
jgi:hypothetical protein